MIEKLLLYSSLFAAGVIVCGMLGCLVPIIGKLKWTKSPLMGLPFSTRIILLLLAAGLTFVGATKTNRTSGVPSSGSVGEVVYTHSVAIMRTSAWQQYFLSGAVRAENDAYDSPGGKHVLR